MGLSPGRGGYGLDAVLSGKASPEVVFVADASFAGLADDPGKVAPLRRARFLAVAGRTANALTRAADVLLPCASHAEKEGTFTNVQGRVQRFERAFLPEPPARPHGELILMLATALGWGNPNWTPADVRREIAREIEAYADVRESELEGGALLKKGDFAWAGAL